MRIRWLAPALASVIVPVATLAATASYAVAAQVRSASSGWHPAQEIAGTGPLGSAVQGGGPFLSCPAAGNCVAAGTGRNGIHFVPFVASQARVGWGRARPVPGIVALDGGTSAFLFTLSCGAAGDCLAGGDYISTKPVRHLLPFVARRVGGRWRPAVELPGMAAFNAGHEASVTTVSCPSAGNCLAGGWYVPASGKGFGAFVASMVHGRWQPPIELPGTGPPGTFEEVAAVSCWSAGNCLATDRDLVARQVQGSWRTAIELPSTVANPGINVLACARTGACAAGGAFSIGTTEYGAFVASEQHGMWSAARQVRGTSGATLSVVTSVSCASHGCVAGGVIQPSEIPQAFVVRQTGTTWGSASILPGIERLDRHNGSDETTVSCGTTCVAAGTYSPSRTALRSLIFVATRVRGTWQAARPLPGIAALLTGDFADLTNASCPPAGPCAVAGTVQLHTGGLRAFVAVQR